MFKTSEAKIFGHHSSYEPNICVQHRHYRNISIKHGWESQAVQNIQIFFFFQSHLKRTIFLASHAFKSFISIIFGHHKQVSNVRSNHSNRTLLEIRVQTTITFRGFEDQGQVQNILRFFFFFGNHWLVSIRTFAFKYFEINKFLNELLNPLTFQKMFYWLLWCQNMLFSSRSEAHFETQALTS